MIVIDLTQQPEPRFKLGDMVRIVDREPVPEPMRGLICKIIEPRNLHFLPMRGQIVPVMVYVVDTPCACGCGRATSYAPEEILDPAPAPDRTPAGTWECTGWQPPVKGAT